MHQLEGIMEALPVDVESGADRRIRYGIEALNTGYHIGRIPTAVLESKAHLR